MADNLYYDFESGSIYHTWPAAYQYDVNRVIYVLNVEKITYYENVRCEFSYEIVPGLVNHETIQVESTWRQASGAYVEYHFPIPDICFQYPGTINAYLCEISDTVRRTLGHFCIRVIGRPKPSLTS